MLSISLIFGIFLFWIIGLQRQQCDCLCDWWHGGNATRDTLTYCSASLDTNYKLNIECSVYAIAEKALPFLPNGTTGIRVTDTLESIEPVNINDTTSCLKIRSARVNKLTDEDDYMMKTANKYSLNAFVFLPLMGIQLLDVLFEFSIDITVGQTRLDTECMQSAFDHIRTKETKVNVTRCLIRTEMITELLTPGNNFKINFSYNDLFKTDFLTLVLNYMDHIWLQEFNGTIYSIALTIQNAFKAIPNEAFQFLANRRVMSISLPNNGFERIDKSDMPYIPTLKNLDFSGCSISFIDPHAWDGLVSLEVLDLSKNKLQTLPVLQGALPNLKTIHLDGQKILVNESSFFDFLQNIQHLKNLSISHMKFNNPWSYIQILTSLEELHMRNASLQQIPQSSLQSLTSLVLLDISDNAFSKDDLIMSSLGNIPNLKTLKLSGSGIIGAQIYQFPSAMPQLETLDLSRNQITNLDHAISTSNNSVIKYLDLSGNSLKPWHQRRFIGQFGTVNLTNNIINDIDTVMLQDFDQFKSLALAGNNFDCSICSLISFQNWVLNTSTALDQSETSPYQCAFPNNQIGEDIMGVDLRNNESCLPYYFNWMLKVLLPLAMVSITVAAVGSAVYLNRWKVIYVLHLMRAKWRKRFQDADLQVYRYDAFVSYCSDDRDWVLMYLIPKMENDKPNLHLCVHERDFEVGEPIMNNIIDCIDGSHRSIFILSDKFVKSQWCQWELQMAQHKLFEDSRDVLTIIKLGPLDVNILPKVLRHLISNRTYLEWSEDVDAQKVFWARLKGSIGQCQCQFKNQEEVNVNGLPLNNDAYIPI